MVGLDDCQDCELKDCSYGLSSISTIIFVVLCSITGLLAIGGNLALLIAFVHGETVRSRLNNFFVLSLTVADMLIGLTMTPLYICYAVGYEPPWLAKLEGFLWIVTVTATTHSLSAVSIDRLIAVVYPLRYHQIITEKRCRVVIAFIWTGSLIFGVPRLLLDDFVKLEKLWIACSIATVAIPLLIMSFSYGRIFAIVRKQSSYMMNSSHASSESLGNRKAAVTIGIIVCLFVITFIPSAVVYFMLLFEDNLCKEYELNDVWLWVAIISFCHSSFNPWVYGLRYREVRKDFKALFLKNRNVVLLPNQLNT